MLTTALLIRAARTLPAGRCDTVSLVARPGGVVHVAVSPLTPSGRFIPVAARAVCRTHTRRLSVVQRRAGGRTPDISGRRVCVRCITSLTATVDLPGLDGRPMTRAQEVEAFELLTPAVLAEVATTLTSVEQTHELGRLASVLHGQPSMKPSAFRTEVEAEVADLHDLIHRTRRRLTSEAMTPEERDTVARAREQQHLEDQLLLAARRRADARDRAVDRQRGGLYVAPWEERAVS